MLDELKLALAEKSVALTYTDAAVALVARSSFSRKYGARNMRRYIQKNIEDRLAELMIADYKKTYSVARIDADGEEITVGCM